MPGFIFGAISPDFALLSKNPIAWTAWHLKLVWRVVLLAGVLTQAMCVVAIELMLVQTISTKDPTRESTCTSPLQKSWYKGLYGLRFAKLVVTSEVVAFWEAIFGLPCSASPEI